MAARRVVVFNTVTSIVLLLVVNCGNVVNSVAARNDTLVITAHNTLDYVFVDGVLQTIRYGSTWSTADFLTISSNSRLVAVAGRNQVYSQCAGFLASVNVDLLLTNNTWKCTSADYSDWYELGFDDQYWPKAVEYGDNLNGHVCDPARTVADVSPKAKWIWSPTITDYAVYCRGYTALCETSSPCLNGGICLQNSQAICLCPRQFTGEFCETEFKPSDTLILTAHSTLYEVYMDGVSQTLYHGFNWSVPDYLQIPPNTRLIAVYAFNPANSDCAGILGSEQQDFFVTDSKWKCSDSAPDNWEGLGFDDSQWPNAVEYGGNLLGHLICLKEPLKVPEISPLAKWIWVDDILNEIGAFCRVYTDYCETSSPCLHGGTCLLNNIRFCDCLPQYTGEFCETNICETSTPCQNNGTCQQSGARLCQCLPQFTGEFCETYVPPAISITAKSTVYELFIDGQRQSLIYGNNVSIPDYIAVPTHSRLIAVTAIDTTSTCAGILASIYYDSFLSDASWKCVSDPPPMWYTLGFDDSGWGNAYIIGPNGNVTAIEECEILVRIPSISPKASWIWTASIVNTPYYNDIISCRAYMPTCDEESICNNGGTCNRNNEALCSCVPGYTGTYCESEISSSEHK